MCGADATGATHPLKCGARAQPDPLFLLLSFSSPTVAAARLPFGPPTKSTKESMVWLLDEEYDRVHRAVHMTERGTDLHPLKIRYHGTADIPYDERYTEFIRPTGLLPFISLVSRGGPLMNPSALTALVDRWRPETHTFHLRAGEMAPTLQDVSMILGLPIQGEPLCMNTTSDGWREQMQLDEACRRSGSGGIGGCMLLLSVWSWDRLSVGRPRVLNERPWPHHPHFPDREPTWAYLWDNVSEMSGDPKIMYMQYTAELDTLTAEQVEWEPYGSYYRIGASMTDLNHKCTEEARFWRMRCPLICMWLVEHHQPQRVMRQFGLYQECPPQWQDTDKALHRLDRQRQRKITNWPVHHSGHIAAFQHCLQAARNAGPEQIVPHDFAAFNNYLEWFHENTRIELVKHAYPEEILDDPIQFDEVGQSQHDTFARRGRSTSIASELNFVRKEIEKTAEECEVIWEQSGTDDKPVGPLRYFIKNTARKMRRLASLLGCREAEIATSSSSEEREIPEDELILSQGILPKRTSKQAPRSAYQLKPRGKGPNRYTPEDYVNRGKKVVTEEDEGPRRRSALSRMRNDEPFSSEEEEEEEEQEQQQEQQQEQPRQRTKRMAIRKQPARTLLGCATCCCELYLHKYRFVNPMSFRTMVCNATCCLNLRATM
ncbi:hypothetical protein QYE76_044791 [Lolium multiflorum]|uniref:Aminotransferase-like plant mobile domain-containing protein n=1 Tax=Lolium multiflorum TaxID=4521 RepID=A0AAD8WZG6_LOLMU|nr:hypothetical protein QYE76_044791 [Lolium multiflorum]